VIRARIVLYAAEGLGNDEIAARLDTPLQVDPADDSRPYVPEVPQRSCGHRPA
jgi:hypothetical protein